MLSREAIGLVLAIEFAVVFSIVSLLFKDVFLQVSIPTIILFSTYTAIIWLNRLIIHRRHFDTLNSRIENISRRIIVLAEDPPKNKKIDWDSLSDSDPISREAIRLLKNYFDP